MIDLINVINMCSLIVLLPKRSIRAPGVLLTWLLLFGSSVTAQEPRLRTTMLHGQANALQADYLLVMRIPDTGATDCLFVRYLVTPDFIRFNVLADQPQFNVRMFPVRTVGLSAAADAGEIRVRQPQNELAASYTFGEAAAIPAFQGGEILYDVRESCRVPALFARRRAAVAVEDQVFDSSNRVVEHVQRNGLQPGRQTKYEYSQTGNLSQIQAFVPEEWLDFQEQGTERRCLQRIGGRQVHVKFEERQVGVESVAVPATLHVASGSLSGHTNLLREAHLLDIRVLDPGQLKSVRQADHVSIEPVYEASARLTARHWATGFRGAAAEQDLGEFRRIISAGRFLEESSPLASRMAASGRLLEIAICRDESAEQIRWLREYLAAASSSPLRPYQYDLAVWLLRRIDASGTAAAYRSLVDEIMRQAGTTMTAGEQLAGILHTQRLHYAPHAFLLWGIHGTSDGSAARSDLASQIRAPAKTLSIRERMLRAWLAASQLPALRRIQRSADGGQSGYLAYECSICREAYPEAVIKAAAEAAIEEASNCVAAAAQEDRNVMNAMLQTVRMLARSSTVTENPDERK